MCKKASNPCPGCTRHAKAMDPQHIFMTAAEIVVAERTEATDRTRQRSEAD